MDEVRMDDERRRPDSFLDTGSLAKEEAPYLPKPPTTAATPAATAAAAAATAATTTTAAATATGTFSSIIRTIHNLDYDHEYRFRDVQQLEDAFHACEETRLHFSDQEASSSSSSSSSSWSSSSSSISSL
ncbi:hypothetical protein HZH66_005883 [Vespula vulgaris]|uniref:Uncharacterized protein n=1 Tax=Vespula vulgaris TaxID=7454 RepID=A0A834NA80_VESVU|nr:hypothetical protein HZH66_005883 [Vespula vulgaris]